jgi:hypothetical protein
MKSIKSSRKIAVTLIVAVLLLTSCGTVTYPTTVCHANDDTTIPYTTITVNNDGELLSHRSHANDMFPMPEGGCPTVPVQVNDGKITICHATSSVKNPYNEITISVQGLNGHDKHEFDIIPVPEGGCPLTNDQLSKPNKNKNN